MAVLGLHCLLGLSVVVESRASSAWGCAASHCGGVSCCGARAPGLWASVAAAHGSVAVAQGHVNLPGPGIEPVSPALAGRSLSTVPPGSSLNGGF